MRRLVILAGGWLLTGAGAILVFAPVPIPLIGVLPLLLGCAILSANSKNFRRGIQALRHRFAFLSHWLERFVHRVPKIVRVMIHKTRPHALHRRARMRAGRNG